MTKKFYITTAIPYVNAAPHIGHALEYVQTDAIARYQKLTGRGVYFLTGTDDNALKNVEAAEKHNKPVGQYVKENSDKFESVLKVLGVNNDDFIRTTEQRHVEASQKFWKLCEKDIYKKKYKGLYCVGCETFYLEKDLVDGCCPEHKTRPELVEEENYFFRLSSYQDWLLKLIEDDELKITPDFRKNEILSFIKSGLEDFSISRSVKRAKGWGIPVPGDPSQIIYVWFDALINYISALGWPDGQLFKDCWPAEVQVIGKGITRFHAIYWPAMLKSAGVEPPKEIFVHGYVTANKEKISKSLGNVIDPFSEVSKYGTDAIRYYLLREIPAYGDGDYSVSRFVEIYNSELANNLGNLVSRVVKLSQDFEFNLTKYDFLDDTYQTLLGEYRFNEAIDYIYKSYVSLTNNFLNEKEPWKLDKNERKDILEHCIANLLRAAYHLTPFIPETANKIISILDNVKIEPLDKPLFPRVEAPKIQENQLIGKIVVGKVETIEKLSDETIQRVLVNIGQKTLKIVCGDLSLKTGEFVPVALPGAKVNDANGGKVKIKKGKVHGVESEAMLCSGLELGKNQDNQNIFRLEETDLGKEL